MIFVKQNLKINTVNYVKVFTFDEHEMSKTIPKFTNGRNKQDGGGDLHY